MLEGTVVELFLKSSGNFSMNLSANRQKIEFTIISARAPDGNPCSFASFA